MALVRTRTAFGGHNILGEAPRITAVRNAVVVGWALYDERRLLVPDSAFAREGLDGGPPGLSTIGAATTTGRNVHAGTRLPDREYVWIGHIHDHFGHFLISTLSRLWSVSRHSPDALFVTPGPGDLPRRLGTPAVAQVVEALGLAPDRFVEVSDGAIIPNISVPEPLLVENSAANRHMSGFCAEVADRIVARAGGAGGDGDASAGPVFLTKHRLSQGVRNIGNEGVLADILQRSGVVVASPETMTLGEQVRLWRRHPLVAAFEGSALHAGLFAPRRKLLLISSNSFASSNQALIDEVAGHQALYLNAEDHMRPAEPAPGFQSTLRIDDPEAMARGILDALAFLRDTEVGMHMRSMRDTVSPWVFLDEPFGTNLSRGRRATMSSVDPAWARSRGGPAEEAPGALSGRLSGTYQFHSGLEDAPWWTVDLGSRCLVNEIRVFNRNDVAHERARHLIVWSSIDGQAWVQRGRREGEADFGGGSLPMPWRWWQDRPFPARHIKLGLNARHFLHLDQVEVFGLPLPDDVPEAFGHP